MMITRAVLDIETMSWEEVTYEPYDGPWALCDRAAVDQAKKAAGTAAELGATEGSNAAAIGSQLTPFYKQEMQAQHLYNPGQLNELLGAAEAPLAGSAATTAGKAASESARTRNTSGFSSALDQAARDRNAALGQASLGVGAQDVMGAKELNQEGARGMQGLYGTDTEAQLKAMGLQNQDIQTQIEAGKSGWFQNLLGGINAAAGMRNAFKQQ